MRGSLRKQSHHTQASLDADKVKEALLDKSLKVEGSIVEEKMGAVETKVFQKVPPWEAAFAAQNTLLEKEVKSFVEIATF